MSLADFPTTPPIGTVPRPWSFPQTARTVLANGLTIAAVRVPTLPIVQVRWCFAAGRAHEPADRVGSARLLQTMMRHGTRSFSSAQLATTLDRIGARLHLGIAVDSSVVSIAALKNHLDRVLDLVDEVTFRPIFPAEALEREKAKAVEIHRHERAQAEAISGLWTAWAIYGSHPYGIPHTVESGLLSTTVGDLRALHADIVDPGLGLMLVVGDIDPEAMVRKLSERYQGMDSGTGCIVKRPPEPGKPEPSVWLIERPGAEQTAVALGMASVARAHTDYMALRVANQVFGGGASSRLFMKLREEQSLTYGAYSTLDCGLFAGDISAELACAPEKTGAAISALRFELDRMATGEIDADDLSHAKQFLVGAFPQRASGVAGVASLVTARWIHALGDDVWTRYQHRVEAVSSAEVGACSMRWFRPEASVWVIVGPESGLERANIAVRDWGCSVHHRTASDADFEGDSGA